MRETTVEVTVLVDNSIMELVPDTPIIRRVSAPGAHFTAEHGLAMLIETPDTRILVDTGATGDGMQRAMSVLDVSPGDIDKTFLSHGHYDHAGGLDHAPGPIITHPHAIHPRYLEKKDGSRVDIGIQDEVNPEIFQFEEGPVDLAPGVRTSGEVRRPREWETPQNLLIEIDGELWDDQVMDDQAVMVNTPRGLVIVAGCAHAGILNTIDHCRRVSEIDEVYMVVGGFHLIGTAPEYIERTARGLEEMGVEKLLPIHCTGFEAQRRLSYLESFEYCTTGCVISVK